MNNNSNNNNNNSNNNNQIKTNRPTQLTIRLNRVKINNKEIKIKRIKIKKNLKNRKKLNFKNLLNNQKNLLWKKQIQKLHKLTLMKLLYFYKIGKLQESKENINQRAKIKENKLSRKLREKLKKELQGKEKNFGKNLLRFYLLELLEYGM